MLASLYHRPHLPWIFPINDHQVKIRFQVAKNTTQRVEILIHEFKILDDDLYHQTTFNQTVVIMDNVATTTFHDYFEAIIKVNAYYVLKIITNENKDYYYGNLGLMTQHDIHQQNTHFFSQVINYPLEVTSWFDKMTWCVFDYTINDCNYLGVKELSHIKFLGFNGIVINFLVNNLKDLQTINFSKLTQLFKKFNFKSLLSINFALNSFEINDKTELTLITNSLKLVKQGFDGLIFKHNVNLSFQFWTSLKHRLEVVNPKLLLLGNSEVSNFDFFQHKLWQGVNNHSLELLIIQYVMSQQSLNDKVKFIEQFNKLNIDFPPLFQHHQITGLFLNQSKNFYLQPLLKSLFKDPVKIKLFVELIFYTSHLSGIFYSQNIFNQFDFQAVIHEVMVYKEMLILNQKFHESLFAELDENNNLRFKNNAYFIVFKTLETKIEFLLSND